MSTVITASTVHAACLCGRSNKRLCGAVSRDSATRDRISSGGIVRGCGSEVALGQPSGMTSETFCTWDSGLYNKSCFMVQASQCSVRE